MKSQTVISVENLSKAYQLGQISTGTLSRDLSVWWARLRGKPNPLLKIGQAEHNNRDGDVIWALREVNFQVDQGEVLGVIGRNGAGKSTLLKILSRVTAPTSGKVRVRGRIASLLEVGTGFHPELTGRENVYLNGAILGMTREEVRRKFDEIVDFAEVEKFIDTPVKRYSSGMYVRLAFAVAAHLDPEILLVDEVLAVGDAEFQKKCLGKMGDVARQGRTVLFVSHNMTAISNLCNCGIVLRQGRIDFYGEIDQCVSFYSSNQPQNRLWERTERSESPLEINSSSLVLSRTQPNHSLIVDIDLISHSYHKTAFLALDISNSLGNVIMQAIPSIKPFIASTIHHHQCKVEVDLPPLIPGNYFVTIWVGSHNTETIDQVDSVLGFTIDTAPTQDRTFPYHANHGYIVPHANLQYNGELIDQ